jgi:hypothetical protein
MRKHEEKKHSVPPETTRVLQQMLTSFSTKPRVVPTASADDRYRTRVQRFKGSLLEKRLKIICEMTKRLVGEMSIDSDRHATHSLPSDPAQSCLSIAGNGTGRIHGRHCSLPWSTRTIPGDPLNRNDPRAINYLPQATVTAILKIVSNLCRRASIHGCILKRSSSNILF